MQKSVLDNMENLKTSLFMAVDMVEYHVGAERVFWKLNYAPTFIICSALSNKNTKDAP